MIKITIDQFKKIFPTYKGGNAQGWVDAINEKCPEYGIVTKQQMAAFLAQIGHESMDLNAMSENLNYSAAALQSVFRKYFPTQALANQYARKPEMIANRAYANRMGNGSEGSGDGWSYRGRGPIAITGKNNYAAFSKSIFDTPDVLIAYPDLVAGDSSIGLQSALWYWKVNNLQNISDFKLLTRRINGGYNGLEDRENRYKRAMATL